MGLLNWLMEKLGKVRTLEERKAILRDISELKSRRKLVPGTKRPVWNGPIPDRYYYMVKNKKHSKMNAFIVRFTDDPKFEEHIRQIVCSGGGHWSLIESDVPLPRGPLCVLRSHGKIDRIKSKLNESHDKKIGTGIVDSGGYPVMKTINGVSVLEEEIFG